MSGPGKEQADYLMADKGQFLKEMQQKRSSGEQEPLWKGPAVYKEASFTYV